jgi:hypothetical protein
MAIAKASVVGTKWAKNLMVKVVYGRICVAMGSAIKLDFADKWA